MKKQKTITLCASTSFYEQSPFLEEIKGMMPIVERNKAVKNVDIIHD